MRVKVKRIWIRFENEAAYTEREEELKEILCGMPGECNVVVYLSKPNLKKALCEKADDQKISILENEFGQENVKVEEVEEEEGPEVRVRRIIPDIVQIVPCNHDMYAVFKEDDGERKCRVLLYALCSDGGVIPLLFDDFLGVSSVEPAAFDADRFELEGGEILLQEGK